MTTTQETTYNKFLLKRKNCVIAINHHKSKADTTTNDTSRTEVLNRIIQLESVWERFRLISDQLIDHDNFEENDIATSDTDVNMEERYIQALSKLKEISNIEPDINLNSTRVPPTETSLTHNNNGHSNEVRLGKLNIRKFNGDYEHWTTFYDAFTTFIDENPNYSDYTKLYYLKDSLTGTALSMINRLPTSDGNYRLAWKLLKERFHNKRAITSQCLNRIINFPKLTQQSAAQLRELIDVIRESLQTIEQLDIPIDQWDAIIVFLIESKLEMSMKLEWERTLNGTTEVPTYEKMTEFLETQHRIIETAETAEKMSSPDRRRLNENKQKNESKTYAVNTERCYVCNESHSLFYCPTFENWSVKERINYIRDTKRCENCFKIHTEPCRSPFRCRICKGLHHTKLHEIKRNIKNAHVSSEQCENNENDSDTDSVRVNIINLLKNNSKILATAIVQIKDKLGSLHMMRAFIDLGSESAFITERAAQVLGLPFNREYISLTGMDQVSLGFAKKSVTIELNSIHDKSFTIVTRALVTKNIINTRISNDKSLLKCKYLRGILLADPNFLSASNVDLLLGVDIYSISLSNGIRQGKTSQPVAQNTR